LKGGGAASLVREMSLAVLRSKRILTWILFASWVGVGTPVNAAFQLSNPFGNIIDDVADFVNSKLGPSDVGASYAALINFAGNPDISTATYYIEAPRDSEGTLTVGRFSFRHPFWEEGDQWKPFVQAFVPYQTLQYDLDFEETEEDADARWDAVGLILTFGNEFDVSERWKITPAINTGAFRLESNAGYRGAISEGILDPAFSGTVFDWTAYSWVLGASLWLDYKREFNKFDAGVHLGATYNHVSSFHSTSDEISFSSEALTLDATLDTVHETPINLNGFPISMVFSVGGTAILGPAGNALGFSSFSDYGVAVQADISRLGWSAQTVQLGGKIIYGPGVTGWSIIFNYDF